MNWLADQREGQELKNSMHFGEIGELAGRPAVGVRKWRIRCIMEKSEKWLPDRAGGGQEMENSMHFGEIGEMRWPIRGGSRTGEFDALWRNRGNKMNG